MKVILSIKPEFCRAIFAGEKRYEYRRRLFKQPVDKVLIYATCPICKIVGEFSADKILSATPELLWEETQQYSGVEKPFFDKYFEGIEEAHALHISALRWYDKPLDPKTLDSSFVAPQSFRYVP